MDKSATLTSPFVMPTMTVGPLATQVQRFLSLEAQYRRRCSLNVSAPIRLEHWERARTYLDAPAIDDLATVMKARGAL
ncbi:hypothetical protein [Rhizorhabdus argentea]|uniref:hypothetical protein n=1 Tax=Rhizorhabdus argentea TaxID=1387174 RepID=UPI0030EBD21E